MKIVVDENIPNVSVQELRSLSHDVLDIRGTPQQGMFEHRPLSPPVGRLRSIHRLNAAIVEKFSEPSDASAVLLFVGR